MLAGSTLLRVVLETGRTHQIRVHMAAIGHPVCGDPQYGVAGRYGLRRQFLHAARLSFPHPVTGVEIDVRSELPADLVAALAPSPRTTADVGGAAGTARGGSSQAAPLPDENRAPGGEMGARFLCVGGLLSAPTGR